MNFPSPIGWLTGLLSWFGAVFVFLATLLPSGCAPHPPAGFPAEFSQAATSIVASVSDQAIWDKIAADLDGSVIEPGYEGYAGVLYVAGGKIRGFSGSVGLNSQGHGTGEITPDARQAILGYILTGEDRYREFLLRLIGAGGETPTTQPAAPG